MSNWITYIRNHFVFHGFLLKNGTEITSPAVRGPRAAVNLRKYRKLNATTYIGKRKNGQIRDFMVS